jgi:L-fuconate dehydratase
MSFVDYVCVSASLEDRVLEYVDHLHEHFVDPVRTRNGRYVPPERPGFSVEMKPESIARHEFPNGEVWRG